MLVGLEEKGLVASDRFGNGLEMNNSPSLRVCHY
jgi:wyosine [tRNA(Phe)-imidazoG37] synthetase (radical SAM superfamily)